MDNLVLQHRVHIDAIDVSVLDRDAAERLGADVLVAARHGGGRVTVSDEFGTTSILVPPHASVLIEGWNALDPREGADADTAPSAPARLGTYR